MGAIDAAKEKPLGRDRSTLQTHDVCCRIRASGAKDTVHKADVGEVVSPEAYGKGRIFNVQDGYATLN